MFQIDLCNESVITLKCVDLLWVEAPCTHFTNSTTLQSCVTGNKVALLSTG